MKAYKGNKYSLKNNHKLRTVYAISLIMVGLILGALSINNYHNDHINQKIKLSKLKFHLSEKYSVPVNKLNLLRCNFGKLHYPDSSLITGYIPFMPSKNCNEKEFKQEIEGIESTFVNKEAVMPIILILVGLLMLLVRNKS